MNAPPPNDRRPRCFDGTGHDGNPLFLDYHDNAWGRPVTEERALFGRMLLESFEAGLTFRTVLAKWAGFEEAFAGFDPEAVAAFGEGDLERLAGDERIIRSRQKIEATVENARATLALRDAGTSLPELAWSFRPDPLPPPPSRPDERLTSPEGDALSGELKARGFRRIGPKTAYALIAGCGVVNDHLERCFLREEVGREQEEAARRMGAGKADPGGR